MSARTATLSGSPMPVTSPQQASAGATATLPPMPTADTTPQNVKVQLQYLKDDPLYDTIKPLQITPNFADREGRTNVRLTPGETEVIKDVRGVDHDFDLDKNGFKYVKGPTKMRDWSSQPKIAQEYLPEIEELLKREVDGCDEIMFYDARIRQSGDEGLRIQGLSHNPFAKQVHLDNTPSSVITKIRNLTELKADYLLTGRCRIINVWRPIKHPVYDCSLAIADGSKLQDGDVIECDRVKASTNEFWDTMGVVKYRPGYHWFYMSEQAEEDVLLFKNYDSDPNVSAMPLHTAFDLPADLIPKGAPTRESIEVRALIFTYPSNGRRPSGAAAPHPLAEALQQGNLKLLDDEHSITDRLRTDIDEAAEVKDAVLLLRRQEIRRLERLNDALTRERDGLQSDLTKANSERNRVNTELVYLQKQVAIQTPRIEALETEVQHLRQQLSQSFPDLRMQLNGASRRLADTRMQEASRARAGTDGFNSDHGRDATEKTLLLQTIQRQEFEVQRWKAEALGKGSEAVSRSWQGSVDEAVRKEREKDAWVIGSLRRELEQLEQLRQGGQEHETGA
ncbi:hypothetical protein LTR36_001333 [Oleoguttula mirabilis]|uniref:Uncharacterized protein n=1 Tax=Oleoguttula mirabilis TaxID=1507867 RepID=A0AAV9JQ25_9PEZI|nr:hypothetical protein LTR36_001333 [Oleoguttula mirabilis]